MTLATSALFGMAYGNTPSGDKTCCFCGTRCSNQYPKRAYMDKVGMKVPQGRPRDQAESEVVCHGCVLSFRERTSVQLPPPLEGGPAPFTDQAAVKNYSWFLTAKEATGIDHDNAFHLSYLRKQLLSPPPAPWAAVCTTNGDENIIWKGLANEKTARDATYMVCLNGENISYTTDDLRRRLELLGRMKAVLANSVTTEEFHDAFKNRYRDAALMLEDWGKVKGEAMTRLGDFLCPDAQECQRLYPQEDKTKVPVADKK